MGMIQRAMTLIEILVSLAIFLVLVSIVTMIYHNVGNAIERTLALLQIHHEGNAIVIQVMEDLGCVAPQVGMAFSPKSMTFMRTHGEPLAGDTHNRARGNAYYVHDLVWVRWYWDGTELRRAVSPRRPPDDWNGHWYDFDTSMGGSPLSGIIPTPQRSYRFFQPEDIPFNHRNPQYRTETQAVKLSLNEFGGYDLSTDIYYRPAKLWWHPGHSGGHNRGSAGDLQKVYVGSITRENGSYPIYSIDKIVNKQNVGEGDSRFLAFSVVNQSGYSVNRDYLHLLGTHPENPFGDFPGRLGLVSEHVLHFKVKFFCHDWEAGRIKTNGHEKTLLYATSSNESEALDCKSYDGLSMTPGARDRQDSAKTKERPMRAEIEFVVHNIPTYIADEDDLDNDGITEESLSIAIGQAVKDNDDLLEKLTELGYVGVVFRHAVTLAH